MVPVTFAIPADARPTDSSNSNNVILWRLSAQSKVHGIGYSESFDASSIMAMEESGTQMERAVRTCLDNARFDPQDQILYNAHGTGTIQNDRIEAALVSRVFGHNAFVNATKSVCGHCIGAAGAIEAAVLALSLSRHETHGCINLEDPVCDIQFIKTSSTHELDKGISASFAFGGHNAVAAMKRFGD